MRPERLLKFCAAKFVLHRILVKVQTVDEVFEGSDKYAVL